MFLGSNQFKNNLGNNTIIKCHQCGDTNLRYVDQSRTNGYPKTYICGNGHETWGAVDDWSIHGQSDVLQTPVNDCCCEGISCDLPKSIYVNFSGLIGVQARESCAHNIYDDIKARVSMPISHCGPCCDVDLPPPNSAWSIDCGCRGASGPCNYSDDTAEGNGCVQAYASTSNGSLTYVYYHSIWIGIEIPSNLQSGVWYTWNPCGPTYPCTVESGCFDPKVITPKFFSEGYPIAYRNNGPSFITELPPRPDPGPGGPGGEIYPPGNTWSNDGHAIRFIVEEMATVTYYDPPPPGPESYDPTDCGCCLKVTRNIYVAKRVHPTATPTQNLGFDWTVSTEGIADPSFSWSCSCALCGSGVTAGDPIQLMNFSTGTFTNNLGSFESNGAVSGTLISGDSGVGIFCSSSNSSLPCSNCNNSIGYVSYNQCDNDGSRRFWPFRVPYYESTTDGVYQLTRGGRQNYPTFDPELGLGECNCISQPTILYPNGDPFYVCTGDNGVWFNRFPTYCTKETAYPPCLASGTYKCNDVDSKYRVQCANPNDYFIKSLVNTNNTDYLDYRYSFDGLNALFTADLDQLDVFFNPIYDFNTSAGQEYDYWRFQTSPNPVCSGLDSIGWWPDYGDPDNLPYTWYDKTSADLYDAWDINAGAKGISRAKFGQLFGAPDDQVQQPHCLRRVKNADLANQYPFYMVNTKDVSDQTLILDRYYPTGGNVDYLWQDRPLGISGNSSQPFINNRGDIGISDIINNRLFPYPFTANSGSLEEPELIAIIHSENGEGGQIAFQTIPVSYDTDILLDPIVVPNNGICNYKTRVTANGYGVMYPLIDDPMWKSEFNYPVILPGRNYSVGDKIEFRCWKTLDDASTRFDSSGNPIATGVDESILREECVETIIATATVTEVNAIGGIVWYEFDEMDGEDYLISVGNCPCTYDVCSEGCGGCVSKDMYPETHNQLEALPQGFPGAPYSSCVNNGSWCPNLNSTVDCGSDCVLTGKWLAMNEASGLGWILLNKDLCGDNCSCYSNRFEADPPDAPGDTLVGDCKCIVEAGNGPFYVGPWGTVESGMCWPTNTTYEFNVANYARSSCSGNPVISGTRAYISGNTTIPPKKPQYKYVWLPSVSGFLNNVEGYLSEELEPEQINYIKDQFLRIEPCNPGLYDRFNRSYKWPTISNSGLSPCRKSNPSDIIPSGVTRTLDNYCRAYGFYQQRQPKCTIEYRGQYIMRSAQKSADLPNLTGPLNGPCDESILPNVNHKYTDCEPIIQDINITLNQLEAQFDISIGAPYGQDYLIPEQLPSPTIGPDGKYEVSADAWNVPSLTGINNTRFFDHGFYEPNRLSAIAQMELPENSNDNISSNVLTINPSFYMSGVDGLDLRPNDIYLSGQWDLPDPRSNCSYTGCLEYPIPSSTLYPDVYVPLPETGIQNNLKSQCVYPWENLTPASGNDYYCMFKNNSAEIVLNEIEQCDSCVGSVLIYNKNNQCGAYPTGTLDPNCTSIFGPFYPDYGAFISWTSSYKYYENIVGATQTRRYLLFRAFGNNNSAFAVTTFKNTIDDYLDIFQDRFGSTINLYQAISSDLHRSILYNMLFEGASNDAINGLTKVEILNLEIINVSGDLPLKTITPLYIEDRCEFSQKTGSIKSLRVQNPGNGYAFEIEERVAPSSIVQSITDGTITIVTKPKNRNRRKETYQLDTVEIIHTGVGYDINDTINIEFNDTDYKRDKIYIETTPSIIVTATGAGGVISDWAINNSGEFYKYIGTGKHRAFPVAIVLNNYWDHPTKGIQNFGRHSKLRAVVGVDPSDSNTYGRIKRVDVEFGGIEYVSPGQYWTIDTTLGDYDQYGNITTGLDIHHLVDPCKFEINGSGFDSEQVKEYRAWMNYPENNPSGTVYFPEKMVYYSPDTGEGDPFTASIKYYLNTNSDMVPTKWENKALDWNTVIISGGCPVNGSGGLLNRIYNMALVEEANVFNNVPHFGNCSQEQCSELINYSNPSCTGLGVVYPNNQTMLQCGDPCPVFTVYDSHRFPIDHTAGLANDINAQPTPWLRGCHERVPLNTDQEKQLFCYNLGPTANYGGSMQTAGFINYPMINSTGDKCYNAEYSLYAEFGKWTDLSTIVNEPALRVKAITYKMKDPITMRISYNDDSVPIEYSGICSNTSGDIAISGYQIICGCSGS